MRWLLHGALTPAVADALRRRGDEALIPADLECDTSDPLQLLEQARQRQLDIITDDASLAAAPFQRPSPFRRSIVFLQLEGGDVEQDDAIDRLFARYRRLTPGRLYTVTGTRVKVRQLPGG